MLTAFIVFGLDKGRARAGKWRVSERTLLLLSLAGGSLGALSAMLLFRHKTRKAEVRGWRSGDVRGALCDSGSCDVSGSRVMPGGGKSIGGAEVPAHTAQQWKIQ